MWKNILTGKKPIQLRIVSWFPISHTGQLNISWWLEFHLFLRVPSAKSLEKPGLLETLYNPTSNFTIVNCPIYLTKAISFGESILFPPMSCITFLHIHYHLSITNPVSVSQNTAWGVAVVVFPQRLRLFEQTCLRVYFHFLISVPIVFSPSILSSSSSKSPS